MHNYIYGANYGIGARVDTWRWKNAEKESTIYSNILPTYYGITYYFTEGRVKIFFVDVIISFGKFINSKKKFK